MKQIKKREVSKSSFSVSQSCVFCVIFELGLDLPWLVAYVGEKVLVHKGWGFCLFFVTSSLDCRGVVVAWKHDSEGARMHASYPMLCHAACWDGSMHAMQCVACMHAGFGCCATLREALACSVGSRGLCYVCCVRCRCTVDRVT